MIVRSPLKARNPVLNLNLFVFEVSVDELSSGNWFVSLMHWIISLLLMIYCGVMRGSKLYRFLSLMLARERDLFQTVEELDNIKNKGSISGN